MSNERIDELLEKIETKGHTIGSLAEELRQEIRDPNHEEQLKSALENLTYDDVFEHLRDHGHVDTILETQVCDDMKSEYVKEALDSMSDWEVADMIRDSCNVRRVMSELKTHEDWGLDEVRQYISNADNDECNEVLYLCWQEVGDSEFASYIASNILPNLGAAERVELSKLSDSDDDLRSIMLSCVDQLTGSTCTRLDELAEYLIHMRSGLAAEVCRRILPSLPQAEADCVERWWQGTDLPTIMTYTKVKAEEGTGYYERILETACGELGFDKAADILISRVPEVAIAANREISPDRYMLGDEAMRQIERSLKRVLGGMRFETGEDDERGEYSSGGGRSVPHISGERSDTNGNSGGDDGGGNETYLCDSPNQS